MNKKIKILIASILLISSFSFIGCISVETEVSPEKKPSIEENEEDSKDGDLDFKPEGDKVKPDVKPDIKPDVKPKPDIKPEEAQYSYKSYSVIKDAEYLEYITVSGKKDSIVEPNRILKELYTGLSIDKDTKVIDFSVSKYNTGVLNVSSNIYDIKLGSAGGLLRIQGIAKTFISAYELDNFIIQIDGKGYSDGHSQLGAYDFVPLD